MKIPLADLSAQYANLKEEVNEAIQAVLFESNFVGGEQVKEFEARFAQSLGVKHCVGVGNATDALFLCLKAIGITAGDYVVTAANTCIATSEAISLSGACPLFVDCEPQSLLMDLRHLEELLNLYPGKVKAIIPVHLYGRAFEMNPLLELANRHHCKVIEDCAQAHYAKFQRKFVGTFGSAAAFSFYPSKNLGAFGDGGAVVTNDDDLAERVRRLSNHGRLGRADHLLEGMNSRLDTLQAAVLNVKLKYIDSWTRKRRELANAYLRFLKGIPAIDVPLRPEDDEGHVWHLFVIRSKNRDSLQSFLAAQGISTAIHYPVALPNLKIYAAQRDLSGRCPIATQLQDEVLSLPLYPELEVQQVEFISGVIRSYADKCDFTCL